MWDKKIQREGVEERERRKRERERDKMSVQVGKRIGRIAYVHISKRELELSGDMDRESNTLLEKEDAYVIRGCSPVYGIPSIVGNKNGFLCEKISFFLYQILYFSFDI